MTSDRSYVSFFLSILQNTKKLTFKFDVTRKRSGFSFVSKWSGENLKFPQFNESNSAKFVMNINANAINVLIEMRFNKWALQWTTFLRNEKEELQLSNQICQIYALARNWNISQWFCPQKSVKWISRLSNEKRIEKNKYHCFAFRLDGFSTSVLFIFVLEMVNLIEFVRIDDIFTPPTNKWQQQNAINCKYHTREKKRDVRRKNILSIRGIEMNKRWMWREYEREGEWIQQLECH